jgi:hypothetical protein
MIPNSHFTDLESQGEVSSNFEAEYIGVAPTLVTTGRMRLRWKYIHREVFNRKSHQIDRWHAFQAIFDQLKTVVSGTASQPVFDVTGHRESAERPSSHLIHSTGYLVDRDSVISQPFVSNHPRDEAM